MSSRRRHKHKSSSKRQKTKSYVEHYESSMNDLIEAFETNLDISPILPEKSVSKTHHQCEEKEIEIPAFVLNTTLETDDIPRIQEIAHDTFYESDYNETATESATDGITHENDTTSSNHDIHSPTQNEINIESECNVSLSKQHKQNVQTSSLIPTESSSLPQLPQESVHTIHNDDSRNISPQNIHNQHLQNVSEHHATPMPNTPQLQTHAHAFSQSYDMAMHHNPYNNHRNTDMQHHLAWSQPQHQHQFQNHIHQQHMHQQQQQWIQRHHMSRFDPQKLVFHSNTTSLNTNCSQLPSLSQSLHVPKCNTDNTRNSDNIQQSFYEMKEIHQAHNNKDVDVDVDVDEDDENLFMPISPTLSGSALRALLSHLRRKCKTLTFKSKQQRKYIINTQHEINDYKTKLSTEKLNIYNQEQNILMLQNQNDMKSLEYLRGAELHQTRQELNFMMQKMNELEANNQQLKQQNILQELDHETYNKSLKEEYQRLLREISQHKVMFDQRGREVEQLKKNSDSEKCHFDDTLKESNKDREDTKETLLTITQQLTTLRTNHEELKKQYDEVYAEKDKINKLLKEAHLQIDEKHQNILSLQRVKDNLQQEIDALSRSTRTFREIRNKSTNQLLESQQHEIDAVKHQIANQYEKYLDEEKRTNDTLRGLLQEKDKEIGELQNDDRNIDYNNNNNEYTVALETENHELRKQLEEVRYRDHDYHRNDIRNVTVNKSIQTENNNDESDIDPYRVSSSTAATSMDEFGLLMLNSAKEEIEQLRKTNETLIKLHAKNHFKKPRVQDQCTQTYQDNMNQTADSSFITVGTVGSMQTQKYFDDNPFEMLTSSPEKSDKVLINDTSIVTTADNSFTNI